MAVTRIAIVSDIHYAGPGEQAHGADFEFAHAAPSLKRSLVRLYRHTIWMRNPVVHNGMLDAFMQQADDADLVVANGDFTCDVAGVGVSHDEACESVRLCLRKLRGQFGDRFEATIGDHELGKVTLLGDHGGLRLKSWMRATGECSLKPFWRRQCGRYVLLGITSTLVGLPVFRPDALESEWAAWETLRENHVAEVRRAFESLDGDEQVVLFCHDPTALAFLWQDETVRVRASQIALTVIGHLHTRLVFWKGRLLAGMPVVSRMGVSVRRMTTALNQARCWKHFRPVLCPSLAGIELHKVGGYLTIELDDDTIRVRRHRLPRPR